MTVKELIEKLEKMPDKNEFVMCRDEEGYTVDAESVKLVNFGLSLNAVMIDG
jgi:hypothetical protein